MKTPTEKIKEIEKEILCERCKKNKATITFTESVLNWLHGFKEEICQECYDKQMRESNWYKIGLKEGRQIERDEIKKRIEELIFSMQRSRDCFGYKEHKVITTNLIYKYPIEEPKTKDMIKLKDFAMGCYQNGWLEAVNQLQKLLNSLGEEE